MKPFDSYPGAGRQLLGRLRGANCRKEYGLQFMRVTGQTTCAYCGMDFTGSYEAWLSMTLDHVIPSSVCIALNVAAEWREDASNRVLACAACNGFDNRYKPDIEDIRAMTLDEFYDLRDRIFEEREERIAGAHAVDRAFFETKPWAIANN